MTGNFDEIIYELLQNARDVNNTGPISDPLYAPVGVPAVQRVLGQGHLEPGREAFES